MLAATASLTSRCWYWRRTTIRMLRLMRPFWRLCVCGRVCAKKALLPPLVMSRRGMRSSGCGLCSSIYFLGTWKGPFRIKRLFGSRVFSEGAVESATPFSSETEGARDGEGGTEREGNMVTLVHSVRHHPSPVPAAVEAAAAAVAGADAMRHVSEHREVLTRAVT